VTATVVVKRRPTGLHTRPRSELRNMVKALSLHPWNNTPEENKRLADAKRILRK
jgi:phosphotransferase system HPr-like phosphotransfer protein